MRSFTPNPALKTWLDWAEQFIKQGTWAINYTMSGQVYAPGGSRITAPALPPEPPSSQPEQLAVYHNIIVPMNDAVNAWNQRQAQLEQANAIQEQMWFQQQSSNAP